ncbi:hypothetical protein ElyMa_006012400 [Elysia marginata]|uniref:Endonuclease/exonuclease/phosphatase domain-containing protein n=1 Tax=Elysia marginata TaxID=1093978 RepID=A0AAV4GHT8_9GAST|nr:hypothetical protein ElyMa_006012400 [Elysia marginata]
MRPQFPRSEHQIYFQHKSYYLLLFVAKLDRRIIHVNNSTPMITPHASKLAHVPTHLTVVPRHNTFKYRVLICGDFNAHTSNVQALVKISKPKPYSMVWKIRISRARLVCQNTPFYTH